MSWRKHFTPVDNSGLPLNVRGAGFYGGAAVTNRYASWLPEVYAGAPNRLMRYVQYDQMDHDLEVAAALDTIAEFGTQVDKQTGLPLVIDYHEDPSDTEVEILTRTLRQWCKLNELDKRIFKIFRSTIKYGDQVFIRDPETFKMTWVDVANIEKVIVNEGEGKEIEAYYIKNLAPNFLEMTATTPSPLHTVPYASGQGLTAGIMTPMTNTTTAGKNFNSGFVGMQETGTHQGAPVDAKHIIHVSLTEGMDAAWPFGVSILEPIFKVFKQKELLEDSIIIYRVHRAPERRVFTIDTGNMPPHKARQYLEQVKYEVQQKRVPAKNKNGSTIVDASYNPMCLDLSTRIPLLDGRVLELNQLIVEHQQGKENWVYSTNPVTGKVVPGNITWAGVTRSNAETIKITLDNGKEIICTPDHKIPVLGKGFVEAKDLTPADPLISFETREHSLSNDKNRSYTQVYDHQDNTWKYVHRIVAEFFKSKEKHQIMIFDESLIDLEKDTVHHKDFNRHNNDPRNLAWMSFEDHKRFHILNKKEYWENITPEEAIRVKNKIRSGLEEYRKKNPDWKECYTNHSEKIKKALLKIDSAVRQERFEKVGKSRAQYLSENPKAKEKFVQGGRTVLNKHRAQNQIFNFTQDMVTRVVETVKSHKSNRLETIEILNKDHDFISLMQDANPVDPKSTQNVKNNTFTDSKLKKMYKVYGYKNWKDFNEKITVYNHRVVSIETVENRDVGTITVDFQERWHDYHTFALDAGIFVKNSMLEDYFFAQTAEGRGSKVETLPAGENLGQIDDLRYFNNKLLRGLRVPSSYLPTGPEDGSAVYNDGKVGTAYIQEYRFHKYVERLQRQIQESLNFEFKMFLKHRGVEIDNSMFDLALVEPMSFSKYKEVELETSRAQLFSQVQGIPYISNKFKLKKYLGLTEEEIKENEELWSKENKTKAPATSSSESPQNLQSVGIRPMSDESIPAFGGEALPGEAGLGGAAPVPGAEEAPGAAPTPGGGGTTLPGGLL